MTTTPPTGRWRLTARTRGGHTVLLDHHLSEEQARELYGKCVKSMLHVSSPVARAASDHILEGRLGAADLSSVEAVQISEDRTVTRR